MSKLRDEFLKVAEYEYSTFTPIHPVWSEKTGFIAGALYGFDARDAEVAQLTELVLQLKEAQANVSDKMGKENMRLDAEVKRLREALDSCMWADNNRGAVTAIARKALAETEGE